MDLTKARFRASHFTAIIDHIEYEWVGGFGAILTSSEKGLKKGEIRAIGGILFQVYRIWQPPGWRKLPQVSWTTVEDISIEEIRAIGRKIFDISD